MSAAKMVAWRSGEIAPKIVGPSAMPATTSPMTRGWRILTASVPNSRATSITTVTAMKKTAMLSPNVSRCLSAVTFSPPAGVAVGTFGGGAALGAMIRLVMLRSTAWPLSVTCFTSFGQVALPVTRPFE